MMINIELIKNHKEWREHKLINKSLIKKIICNVLGRFDNFAKIKEFELSILLTNNLEMIDLNTKFRGVNKTTNVLSFPSEELNWQDLRFNDQANSRKQTSIIKFVENSAYMYLGDIAFSYEVTYNEAIDQEKTFENHFIHLLIHSILHLIGFDHQHDEEANIMENLEIEILSCFNIPSPY